MPHRPILYVSLALPRLVSVWSLQVRARLERKLVARKKEFAFNFPLDDEGGIRPEATTDSAVDERTSFRFDFHKTEPGLDGSHTELPPSENRRQLQDFAATSTLAPLSHSDDGRRKEGNAGKAGKKQKKKKKKKRKEPSEVRVQDSDRLERIDKAGAASSSAKGLSRRIAALSSVEAATDADALLGTPIAPALPESHGTGRADMMPAASSGTAPGVSLSGIPEASRPSPGLTLESWKDPALTDEERRRRRFGCGVRNMAAIERRSDNRRVGLANMSRAVGSHVRPPANGEAVAESQVESLPRRDEDASTGSSVFSFGFDIGISFNGC